MFQRIEALDPRRPYVWQLRLTEAEYHQLEKDVRQVPHVIDRAYALRAMVYVAEWYKRDYEGEVRMPLEGVAAESLWRASGIDTERYVYRTAKTARYLESLYMLGGLPLRFLLSRSDRRLLKAFCRLYKGELVSLDDDPTLGRGQAFAFQSSIREQGSIYAQLKSLLLRRAPSEVFAESDLTKGSLASDFVRAVEQAYEEVMRDKFRLEWVVEHQPSSPYLRRMIRLHLRPEEMGGQHTFLRFERAQTWRIPQLMQQRALRVRLRFSQAGRPLPHEGERPTLITFENTGQEDTGFEATGLHPWGVTRAVPTDPFDRIEVVVTDDEGRDYAVQELEGFPPYLQVWAMPDAPYRWTSQRSQQQATAVVCASHFTIADAEWAAKPFFDPATGFSEVYRFCPIDDHVTLRSPDGSERCLWNRAGYLRFAPRLYPHLLRYDAGRVRYVRSDDEDETEEWYPALFDRADIRVQHFTTRDVMTTAPTEAAIARVEFKPYDESPTAPYAVWCDGVTPPYGRLRLRLTIKDEERTYAVVYLPSLLTHGGDEPLVRDCEHHRLVYVDAKGSVVEEQVGLERTYEPLPVTRVVVPWGNERERVELDVIQPTQTKEVYLDGRLCKYLDEGERLTLPFLLRDRITLRDFSPEGFAEHYGTNVGELCERGSMDRWLTGATLATDRRDSALPPYLEVKFGNRADEGRGAPMIYWDYEPTNEPRAVTADFDEGEMAPYSICFQDMRRVGNDLLCLPPVMHNNQTLTGMDWSDWSAFLSPDAAPNEPKSNDPSATDEQTGGVALMCYDMAVKYETYFFIFNPLFNLTMDEFVTDVARPLRERNGGELAAEDWLHLVRCAAELGLDWSRLMRRV